MKRLTKGLLAIVCAGLLFTACQSDESITDLSSSQVEIVENPYALSEDNALRQATTFRREVLDDVQMRSSTDEELESEIKKTDFTVTTSSSDRQRTKQQQAVPVYTISYKDKAGKDAGVVVTIGDERVSDNDKIIMYATDGELKDDWTTAADADFIKDMIAGYIHNKINNPEDKDAVQLRYVHNLAHTDYMLPMQSEWPQTRDPYNRYAKGIPGKSQRFHAGCVAVAMAQITSFHNWPLSGTFPRYTNPHTTNTLAVSYALTADEHERLRMARDVSAIPDNVAPYPKIKEHIANRIAECAHRVNMMYGMEYNKDPKKLGSYAYDDEVPAAFRAMGYLCDNIAPYNFNTIRTNIQNQRPVYMSGTKSDGGSGHAYIVKGVILTKTGDEYICFALNDQWHTGGYIFNSKLFSTGKSRNYTPDPTKYEIAYDYSYYCRIIANIRPNK